MKLKTFLLALFLSFWGASFAQETHHLSTFSFGFGSNIWLQSKDLAFGPKYYKGNAFGYNAIPVNDFTPQDRSTVFSRLNLYVSGSWTKEFNEGQFINVALGFAQNAHSGTNGSRLRYTDQIEEGKGFVNPSTFDLKEYHTASQYLFTRPQLQFALNMFGIEQKIGVGLLGYLVLHSNYSLHLQLLHEDMYYKESDLTIRDFVWQIVPEISHQVKLKEFAGHQVSFNTLLGWRALHFNQRAIKKPKTNSYGIWTPETIKPILSFGITLAIKKDAT